MAFVLGCCPLGYVSCRGNSPYPTLLASPSRSPRRPLASGGWLCGVEEDGGGLVPLGLLSRSFVLARSPSCCLVGRVLRCGLVVFVFLVVLPCLPVLMLVGGGVVSAWVVMYVALCIYSSASLLRRREVRPCAQHMLSFLLCSCPVLLLLGPLFLCRVVFVCLCVMHARAWRLRAFPLPFGLSW